MANKLTVKQERYKNARISGVDPSAAYDIAYDHKMSRNAVNVAAQKLERHPIISLLIEEGRKEATERAIVTTEEVVRLLLTEGKGQGEDSTPSSRVAALSKLTDFTGGFDANKQKVQSEVTGKDGNPIENQFTVEFVNAAPKG